METKTIFTKVVYGRDSESFNEKLDKVLEQLQTTNCTIIDIKHSMSVCVTNTGRIIETFSAVVMYNQDK